MHGLKLWVALVFALASMAACGKTRELREAPRTPDAAALGTLPIAQVSENDLVDAGGRDSQARRAPVDLKDLNVILLSVDSLRADMPWAGYPRSIANHLTALEAKSVGYTHAYSISSYTSMSLGGLLGGKLPSEMKRSGFFFGHYPKENVMFPELLQAKGIRTMSAHAHGYFSSAGFEQGFDVWQIVPGIVFKNETDPNVTSPQHEAIAEKMLDDARLDTGRFFAWFHFLDPHDQYMPHDKDGIPPYGKTLRDRYDAEVTFTDRYIGKLLAFIDTKAWSKRTAIVVTADHGEAFGEHGQVNHGFEVWENLVRVPLFFVIPGVRPRHIDTPRSALDLAPTLLDLFGAVAEPDFEGKSLVPELFGDAADEEARDVVIDLPMTSDSDRRRALLHDKLKIVAYGKEETLRLYDLEVDPGEKVPIARGDAFEAMSKRYRDHAKTIHEVAPTPCNIGCLNRAYAK